ncbi:MAG: amino acid permease [Eggerthella lenta]
MDKRKGIGLFGLIGMVISSCIGSGVFAITGQLAQVASPGSALIAWGVVGVGFMMLALSLANLGAKRPDLHGIFQYAEEGFGCSRASSRAGVLAERVAGQRRLATMMMSTLGYFFPAFLPGNTVPCILIASVIMWLLTLLVIRGVESASFLNAIVMVCKVASIAVFILFTLFLFNANVFTADFWGTLQNNMASMGELGADAVAIGSVGDQVKNCLIILMWTFVGIEGATVMSSRARKKSDVGKATVIGLICLLLIYISASVLPYGYLPYTEIAAMNYPAMLYVFDSMAPGWGGAFISIAIIISVMGSWLSFTILPAETTSDMAKRQLLPAAWGKMNAKNAPRFSLLIVGACTQVFMLTLIFSEDAYNCCTVGIVITQFWQQPKRSTAQADGTAGHRRDRGAVPGCRRAAERLDVPAAHLRRLHPGLLRVRQGAQGSRTRPDDGREGGDGHHLGARRAVARAAVHGIHQLLAPHIATCHNREGTLLCISQPLALKTG